MDRATKETIVEQFGASLGAAQAVVLTQFSGLTVDEAVGLRDKLREQGVQYQVIKNTLAKRAIAGTDLESVSEFLTGPTAWAYSTEDPVAPAKVLVDFVKDLPDGHLTIKAGWLSGKALSADEIGSLAKMPGKDELRSKLLSVFNASGTKFVRVLAARPSEFLNVLTARKNELDEAA